MESAVFIPKRLVERQITTATAIPKINNMTLLVNIICTSITDRHTRYA
jgi:hypothetical protein